MEIPGSTEDPVLAAVVQEYKKPHSPELLAYIWSKIWSVWGEKPGLDISVPPCDWTQEEIQETEQRGNMLIYVPPELSTQDGRHLFLKIFPKNNSYCLKEGNPVENDYPQYGWLDVETSLSSPHGDKTEDQLREFFESQGRIGQTLNTYMVGSEFSKLVNGSFFDENDTWSRLLGSNIKGKHHLASYYFLGFVDYQAFSSERHHPEVGGRSVGVRGKSS